MTEVETLIEMSRLAGERPDLVQAGGGNSSVKINSGKMLIKASGFLLSELDQDKGYLEVDNEQLKKIFSLPEFLALKTKREREDFSKNYVESTKSASSFRPSIETLLHSLLLKYTLHTHPIAVNAYTLRKNWVEELRALFPDALFIPYQTPGVELALNMRAELEKIPERDNSKPMIVFLQNHGLIISSNSPEDIMPYTDRVCDRLAKVLRPDFSGYKLANTLSRTYNKLDEKTKIAYLSRDADIIECVKANPAAILTAPFCPDTVVFTGAGALIMDSPENQAALLEFREKNQALPLVIQIEDSIYFMAPTIKKAREMEEVFKLHLVAQCSAPEDTETLSQEEMGYLLNWEAEKYRQKL